MSRVEARLSASRSMVAINSTVGKAENSSGAWMNSDVNRISTENLIEMASEKSSNSAGKGRMRTTRIAIMATASPMSLRLSMVPRSTRRDSAVSPRSADGASVMLVDRFRRSRGSKLCAAAGGPPARMNGAALASKAGLEECGGKGYASQAKCAGYMVTEGLTSAQVLGSVLRLEAL